MLIDQINQQLSQSLKRADETAVTIAILQKKLTVEQSFTRELQVLKECWRDATHCGTIKITMEEFREFVQQPNIYPRVLDLLDSLGGEI